MVTLIALLVAATLAGGLIPLLASRFREGGLHLLVAVSAGLVLGAFLFHLAPEFLETEHVSGGAVLGLILGFALMGAWGLYRSRQVQKDTDPHGRVWLSALLGMSVHALTAGVGLSVFDKAGGFALIMWPMAWHKATEGLSLSSLLQLSGKGPVKTVGYLTLFSLATPLGLLLGSVGLGGELGFTAGLAAGSFLYVVVFDFLPEAFHGAGNRVVRGFAVALGLLIGALGMSGDHGHGHEHDHAEHASPFGLMKVLEEGWHVLTQMSPWLLGGFLIAGVLSQVLDSKRIGRWLGGGGIKSVVGAALVGAPLPLCSCSVLPVASALRKEGASRGATSAFLISTPETGVDSISVTWGLLGPVMAIARFISSITTAIITGFAVSITPEEADEPEVEEEVHSCCMHKDEEAPAADSVPEEHVHVQEGGFLQRVFRYAYIDMMDDLAKTLLVGLGLAAFAAALLPEGWLNETSDGPMAYLVMLVIGIPLYVCASASTPIAATLIAKGLAPGAALVFLLAGPATNLATLAVLRKTLGVKAATVHLAVLAVSTLALGVLFDVLLSHSILDMGELSAGLVASHDHAEISYLSSAAAVVLLSLIGAAIWRGAREEAPQA
jgi:uncharacterized membrane protein YraQ (UPF0718 family)